MRHATDLKGPVVRLRYVTAVIDTQWSDVAQRVARLSGHPTAGEVFGARGHQWKLEPPLTADELAEAESQLRIELPAEYRSFLLEVSRGGAGPAYGLFPLRRIDGRWQWEGDGADITDLTTLARPFPHTEAFNPADGLPDPPVEKNFDSTEAFNSAEDTYWERHDTIVYAPEHSVGLLYLCHLGCACREVLVVSGPARGQMWTDDTASDGGFRPVLDEDGTRLGFARWYRRWLEQAEAP
jgi:SMI1/KNR4 family protein SUKH-1